MVKAGVRRLPGGSITVEKLVEFSRQTREEGHSCGKGNMSRDTVVGGGEERADDSLVLPAFMSADWLSSIAGHLYGSLNENYIRFMNYSGS